MDRFMLCFVCAFQLLEKYSPPSSTFVTLQFTLAAIPASASAISPRGDSVIHGKFGAPALSLSMERVLLCSSHEWRNKRAAKIMRALRAVMTRESRSIRMQSLRRRREQERTGRMDGSRWWRARFIHRRWISTRPAKIKPAEWIGCWQLVYKNINATPIAWKIERLPRTAAVRAAACAGMQL